MGHSSQDHSRDPCPWVILNDLGGAFVMGAVGGGIWHSVKGAKNSPRGERLTGAVSAMKARAPVLGGNFAVWGGLFSTFDCGLKGIRQKEDPWNSIISGGLTGGVLAARGGVKAAAVSAVVGSALLALIEGVGIGISRMTADQVKPVMPQENEQNETNNKSEKKIHEDQVTDPKIEESFIVSDDVPLIDIFHTLEFDMPAMIEQRKLEEFEAQEQLNEAEEEKENAAAKSLQMFNADGNFNLKYLLQGIVANRQKTSLSDRELQNLLSDFKPHRSKWANDDRVGQEELYEACEKVLTDLKNYTEHSTPFLNKVNKREAPDYFDVIEKPMDLGTVTKKMKNLAYKSKKEFADDLFLIYENCLAYNTNSASEYRKHAIAMRRKTERLLSRVPNITIKDLRPDIEEEGDDISEDDEQEPTTSRKSVGKHMVFSSINERKSTPVSDHQFRERSMTRGSSVAIDHQSDIELTPEPHHHVYGGKSIQKDQSGYADPEEEEKNMEAEIDDGEFQDQVWREKTKRTRAKLTTDVEKQYQFPFGEREALVRSSLDMERFAMIEHLHDKPKSVMRLLRCDHDRFLKWTDRRSNQATLYDDFDLDSSDDENLDAFFSRKIAKPDKTVDDAARTDLFLPDYNITTGMPEIEDIVRDLSEPACSSQEKGIVRKSSVDLSPEALLAAQGYSSLSLDLYPELDFPTYGLNPLIDKSNQKLEQIRLVYAKCNAIRNNVPISSLTGSIELETSTSSQEQLSIVPSSSVKERPPLSLNSESGHQLAQKILSKILLHAGFEGAKVGALNVLTDIMTNYLTSIGKTMRSYSDNYGHQMNGDEMLSHSLYENGVLNISELEDYVHDDVERGMQRLDDLHRRLQTSYQDLLSGPIEKSTEDEEELLNEEETFITGIFGEDLGEDYFGFRELGLDREYNMGSLQIPSRLWFGKNKDNAPIKSIIAKEPQYRFPPPPNFLPIKSEKAFIGLLQPYFAKKLPLVEDEFIPNRNKNRPRYPPTNKIAAGRKKLAKDSSHSNTGTDHKKYKRKRPAEEIVAEKAEKAEKKRQKMEEKAQRIAEKEQKRRLREELKEQEKQAKMEAKEKKKLLNKKTKQPKNTSHHNHFADSPSNHVEEEDQI
ncbi:Transcriptional activator spt7 [Rhizopus stolonifer]|uniref:Transcriptional activator spt7 n=1 Tax=Rhizopus stolonifer TaxID=4846 RepID=A0A367KWJ1_RHIST|nr:Transcriptional activator spt7 [Rhizopus stolonifer]